MSSYGRYYRPTLKNSVDVQLQTAFNEGLWPNVIRLAAQRFKTKKDPYYEVGHHLPPPPICGLNSKSQNSTLTMTKKNIDNQALC